MDKKPVLVLILSIVSFVGCKGSVGTSAGVGGSNNIVGTWQGTEPNPLSNAKTSSGGGIGKLPDMAITLTLNPNGSYSLVNGTGQLSTGDDGTYTYDDSAKQLNLKMEKMSIAGQDTKMPTMPGNGISEQVTWKSANEILIKALMSTMDLKRK